MGKFRRIDADAGRVNRQVRAITRDLREQRAAKRLPASSFTDLLPGSIPQSAVTNQSAPGYVSLTTTGSAILAAGGLLIDSSATVPTGFTSCVVSLTARAFAYNSTATDDYLYAQPIAAGVSGNALPVLAPAGQSAFNVAPVATVLTGLTPGSLVSLQLWAATSAADWAADPSNLADLSGVLLWF